MTGLNPFKHGVIEVGMMVMDEKFEIIWEFLMDLCPPKDCIIDDEALAYNGFTRDRIAKGKSYEEFCDFFKNFYIQFFDENKKPIIIGQYITADLMFLSSVCNYANYYDLYMMLWNDIIDTKSLANQKNAMARYFGDDIPFISTSLSKPKWLSEVLWVDDYVAHTARGDILATRAVLLKFLWIKS